MEELVTAVSIALGETPLSACTPIDANADGVVTIDEVIRALNNALNGCGTLNA